MSARYQLLAQVWDHGPRGPLLHLSTDGVLSTGGRPREFASVKALRSTLRVIKRVLGRRAKEFQFSARRVMKNPSGYETARAGYLAELDRAADAYSTFTGRSATKEKVFREPRVKSAFELGPLVAVTYEADRGEGLTHFEHKFKKKSRPLLAASSDGKFLKVVGGQFSVNPELGIVDDE